MPFAEKEKQPKAIKGLQGVYSLNQEGPGWLDAKVQECLDIPSFRNAARRDASAVKM